MGIDLLVRLILLLPLAGAVCIGLSGLFVPGLRTRERLIGTVATVMVGIPFAITVYLFASYGGEPVVTEFYTWMAAGDFEVSFAFRIDELSLLMTMIVTGVGGVIHLYSIGYMRGDGGTWRFFAYLNLFIFAMLNLVLANNLPVLFLGWEGVGLCSYLLIGYWYTDLANSAAANKAFIMNRVGDFAFLMAMFVLYKQIGTLDFEPILEAADALPQGTVNWIVLLLFIGATGKSAQIPLFTWLPDAMAGPTPVSALIHAATMVTSGLYLLARLSPVVLNAPVMMVVVAVVGGVTAIMAATIAITQNDIKKVLAYSTVSQLGYMFAAAGVGAFFVSIFHVMTHAFFKGCLFLGSGSVIHAMHEVEHELEHEGLLPRRHDAAVAGEEHVELPDPHYDEPFDPQDMRTMGGLAKYMPSTARTYLISTLAIAGIPPLAGFFSKDEILFKAFEYGYSGHPYAYFVWILGLITAFLTAFYMMRSYMLTFQGKERWKAADRIKPRESPATMIVPLWILAALAAVGGFLGLPGVVAHGELNWIHHWLGAPYGGPVAEPAAVEHGSAFLAIEWLLLVAGALIAVGGVLVALYAYRKHGLAYDQRLRVRFGGLYETWKGKYYWDEFYEKSIVRPLLALSDRGLAAFDAHVIDGAVNGLASVTSTASGVLRYIQTGRVQNYAAAIVVGVIVVVALMLFA
jgi:NADH-quinone oxidoreductase subunit L